jgi:hypothetical protein
MAERKVKPKTEAKKAKSMAKKPEAKKVTQAARSTRETKSSRWG